MLGSRTDLHTSDAGSVNGTRFCNEILLPYVRLFRGAMGLQFLFMDDNAPCHRTVAAEQLLESESPKSFPEDTSMPYPNPLDYKPSEGLKLSPSTFRITESDEAKMTDNRKEDTDYKYFKSTQTAQELILRIDNKSFNEITILLEHSEKTGNIPNSSSHLLHAELKNKIPRRDKITHMYSTRSGKIKISTSDPICAVQITAIEQILNIPVKANIIWEGFTSRFLLFDIPTNVHLTDVATELKNSNDIEIVEIRRFIKKLLLS
ncbi:uncharacterized protein TNCV_2363731 [Trichonephila clavipes]|nr:uncharacterized protein TNCV_2363731 [Trichonephila clavipes]